MRKTNLVTVTIRVNPETKEFFDSLVQGSGANSNGEYFQRMCETMNMPEQHIEPEIRTVTIERPIEKQLQPNEILLSLNPQQMFAIRQTVLSSSNFAQEQNEIIDSLKTGSKPFLYMGSLFDPELQSLWMRNIVILKTMSPEQIEAAIRHNMSAFLINKYLYSLIEGKLSCSQVTAQTLKSFIRKQIEDSKPKLAPISDPVPIKI